MGEFSLLGNVSTLLENFARKIVKRLQLKLSPKIYIDNIIYFWEGAYFLELALTHL